MSETQVILKRLDELSADLRANTKAVNEVVVANAVLTERVDNHITKVDEHIESDKLVHADQGSQLSKLKEWQTGVRAKVATYAAVAAFAFGLLWDFGKEALAKLISNG